MTSTTSLDSRPGLGVAVVLTAVLGVAVCVAGCDDSPSVQDADLKRFRKLYRGGLAADDPYVRAETLRIMERLERRDLPGDPTQLVEDEDPMVRVAALRVLFATDHPEAQELAMNRFSTAEGAERRGILEAALEYGADGFQRRLVWRALRPSQPRKLRKYAVDHALEPWVRRAQQQDEDSVIQKLLVSNVHKYVRKLDPEVGGPILRLLLDLGKSDAARRPLETLRNGDASLDARLRAARVLIEARADAAKPVFRSLLEKARSQGEGSRLKVPDEGMDKRLVRSAVLGVTAHGDRSLVSRAKSYLKEAPVGVYTNVLEALRSNKAEGARLAIETAMVDARPRVRHRAIELYAQRDDAEVAELLEVAIQRDFSKRQRETRKTVGRVLGGHFSENWSTRLRDNLTSTEGVLPALRLLVQVHAATGRTDLLGNLRESLLEIAEADDERAAALAGYLLIQIPEALKDQKIRETVRGLSQPKPRYAYLRSIVESAPSKHVEFLLRNFYAREDAPELYSIRAMSGVGLWLVQNPAGSAD